MDEKAANEGDKLKHALLLEVLDRCRAWERLVYAETHAGAGRYLASAQASKQHIKELQALLSGIQFPIEGAGKAYGDLLREWWASNENNGRYPGSVLQACRFLTSKGSPNEFRVVEADEDPWRKLADVVNGHGVNPIRDGFQNRLAWFTKSDSLILLIDPFSFDENYGEFRERRLNNGGIDLPTLDRLLGPAWAKKASVILFWCAFPHEAGQRQKRIAYDWLKRKCDQNQAELRCFHKSSYYSTFIIGVGSGRTVVAALPDQEAWKRSWLKHTVYESCDGLQDQTPSTN